MSDKLAEYLREETEQRGWSIREFARRADISHSYAANIINADTDPNAETCVKIAKTLNVSPESIFRMAGYLSPVDKEDKIREELLYWYGKLEGEDRLQAMIMVQTLAEVRERYPPSTRGGTIGYLQETWRLVKNMSPEERERLLRYLLQGKAE